MTESSDSKLITEESSDAKRMTEESSDSNKITKESSCAVCHQPIPQGRVHYGGVSCYSCRAFFRRNTQREEILMCKGPKGKGECIITYIDRKQCSSCRYDKCLRIGMQPELVLTEDEKKKRFEKLLRKKEKEAHLTTSRAHKDSDDGSLIKRVHEMPPLQLIQRNDDSHNEKLHEMPYLQLIPKNISPAGSCSMRNSFPFFLQPPPPGFFPNMYSPNIINSCQDSSVVNSQMTNNLRSKEKDFLAKLRLEVKNHAKNNKYEQIISQESLNSVPHNFLPTSREFSLPSSLSVTVKPVSPPFTKSPQASHNAFSPQTCSNGIKDAWTYFKNMEYLSRQKAMPTLLNISENNHNNCVGPSKSLLSENGPSSEFPPYPINYSISSVPPPSSVSHSLPLSSTSPVSSTSSDPHLPRLYPLYRDQNPVSVITNQSQNQDNSQIKLEPKDKEDDRDPEPENSEGVTDHIKKEHIDENPDLLSDYVHKKFRTHAEESEKSSENDFLLKRKSVIFHGNPSKKICV